MLIDDLDLVVRLSLARLAEAADADWDVPAGTLTWTCWETAEHLADDLMFYATQFSPRVPPPDGVPRPTENDLFTSPLPSSTIVKLIVLEVKSLAAQLSGLLVTVE